MDTYVKYLVQVQSQSALAGYAEEIFQAVSSSFNVTGCRCDGDELALEIQSNHPLAYGVFKDLADLVQQSLARRDLRLLSGAIHRVERHPLSAMVEAFTRGAKGSVEGISSYCSGSFWQRVVDGIVGGLRLTPVMYFYGEVCIDLMLADKARRISMQAAAEAN